MNNKRKADLILMLLSIGFLVLAVLKHFYGEPFALRMTIYVVEAALVGSVADWFAVTVLFKRPMGLPVKPIIPSNRVKILKSLNDTISMHLLDMSFIKRSIESIRIDEILIDQLVDVKKRNEIKNVLIDYAMMIVKKYSGKNGFATLKQQIRKQMDVIEFVKSSVVEAADYFINRKFTMELYAKVIDRGIAELKKQERQQQIYSWLSENIDGKKKGSIVSFVKNLVIDKQKLTENILEESIGYLEEIKADKEKYKFVKTFASRFSKQNLKGDGYEKLVTTVVVELKLEAHFLDLMARIEVFLTDIRSGESAAQHQDRNLAELAQILLDFIEDLWNELKKDKETRSWIDSISKEIILDVLEINMPEFGKFVGETIGKISDEHLCKLVQSSAGEPLHLIRINGAELGAMLGVILFLFANFVLEPYLIPLLWGL